MLTRTFAGQVSDTGGLRVLDRRGFMSHLEAMAGEDVEVIVRKPRVPRSLQSNKRYWALLTVAGRELGEDDADSLHEGLAHRFLKLPEKLPGVPRRQSTTELTTEEFANYVDQVERFFRIDLLLDLSGWDDELERLSA